MQSSKLIQVLKTFTKEEFKTFEKFLNSPIFFDGIGIKKSVAFLQFIQSNFPHFEASKLKKERAFKKLYPGQEYITGKIEKQMSNLFKYVEAFIVFQNTPVDREMYQLLNLSAFYQQRRLYNLAKTNIKKQHKFLQNKDQWNSTDYHEAFLWEKQLCDYQALSQDFKEQSNLPLALESLDQYYIFEKLTLACQLLSIHRFLFPVDFKKSLVFIDQLAPLLEANHFDIPIIKIYYKAYRLLRSEEQNAKTEFLAFEKELNQYYEVFSSETLQSLNALIRNYSIRQYHKGLDTYLEKAFQLYQAHLEEGYLYYEGKLLSSTMGNIVVFGLRLKQFDWVFQFIQQHKNKVTGTSSPNIIYSFNLANYYFYTADYPKALDCLADTYEDTYYKLAAKRLEIKIYYEMQHVLLAAKIDAFKIFIYRLSPKSITEIQKEGNRNFIDLLKQIHLPRTFQNKKRIEKLTNKIKQLEYITEKDWLIEKVQALN